MDEVIYQGLDGHRVNVITARDGNVENVAAVRPLPHVVKHSPTGFSWGYQGSGPAELARCLLIDALGDRARCATCGGSNRVVYADSVEHPRPATASDDPFAVASCVDCEQGISALVNSNYQTFKREFVATWPQDKPWYLTRQDIRDWVATREAVPSPA